MRVVSLFVSAALILLVSPAFGAEATQVNKGLTQIQRLVPTVDSPFGTFGTSIAVDGDLLVVGAPGVGAGSTFIFDRNCGGRNHWGLVKTLVSDDGLPGDSFGGSVSLSGDYLVVASYFADIQFFLDNQGAAYVFERNAGGSNNWGQVAKLIAPDGKFLDYFGSAVSVSHDTIIVGALGDCDPSFFGVGSAYLFERNQLGEWPFLKKLLPGDLSPFKTFGRSVAIHNENAIVGASDDGGFGSAYLFGRNVGGSNVWGQFKKLTARYPGRSFGWSVALNDHTVAVGDPDTDVANSQEGTAYVFAASPGKIDRWVESNTLYTSNGTLAGHFGLSVALDNERLLVGSEYENVTLPQTGSAYLFERAAGTNNIWNQIQTIIPSDVNYRDQFGFAMGFSSGIAAIGAPYADSATAPDKGAVYIFSFIAADLAVDLMLPADPIPSGSDLHVTVSVTNAGPDTATGVTLINPIPSGAIVKSSSFPFVFTNGAAVFDIGTLPPNGAIPINMTLNIEPCAGILTNRPSVFANEPDPNITNNTAVTLSTIRDLEPPRVICPTNRELEFTSEAGVTVFFAVAANDSCSPVELFSVPASGSLFPIGTNVVLCLARDGSGNSNSCEFVVTVVGARGVKQRVLMEISAIRQSNLASAVRSRLDAAMLDLASALDPVLWKDETHLKGLRAEAVFQGEKNAALALSNLSRHGDGTFLALVVDWVDRMARADRLLAQVAISDALLGNGNSQEIELARSHLRAGDQAVLSGKTSEGIEHFREAWGFAISINDRVRRLKSPRTALTKEYQPAR